MTMKHQGFTLAEVLIALALLGVIAAFAVPKVLQAVQKNHFNAMAKEALSMGAQSMQNVRQQAAGRIILTPTTFDSQFNALNKPAQAECAIIHPGVCGLDVNGDGNVTSADSTLITNNIGSSNPLYDVDGDGGVYPLDVLLIINYINAGSNPITADACYNFANGSTLSIGQYTDGAPVAFAFKPSATAPATDMLYFSIRATGQTQTLGQQKQNTALDPPWFKL